MVPKPGIAPSASHVDQVAADMKRNGVKAIITESYRSRRFSDLLARQSGGEVVPIPGGVGGERRIDSYFALMDAIVDCIAQALAQRSYHRTISGSRSHSTPAGPSNRAGQRRLEMNQALILNVGMILALAVPTQPEHANYHSRHRRHHHRQSSAKSARYRIGKADWGAHGRANTGRYNAHPAEAWKWTHKGAHIMTRSRGHIR